MADPVKLHPDQPIKIETGIPPPLSHGTKYPWAVMNVGDSFFVPGKTVAGAGLYTTAKRHNYKITCRTVDGGCRVWRTA